MLNFLFFCNQNNCFLTPCALVALLVFFIGALVCSIELRARRLEKLIQEKTHALSKTLQELKSTQLRLLETGKISAMASLSAGILHQLSQPITAIQGFIKFMRKEMKEDDQFYRPVKLMDEQTDYIKQMLEDLMELIRHREIKKEKISVNLYLRKALDLLVDELRIRRVNWDVVYGKDLPEVFADGIHLQQVFMNIAVNAIQALGTLPGGVERSLKIISSFDQPANKIRVIFSDNGPGLSREDKNIIFEPFFSTKTKGSGIGLALCKDLVAEHGGSISVESQPGQGAVFVVALPVANVL